VNLQTIHGIILPQAFIISRRDRPPCRPRLALFHEPASFANAYYRALVVFLIVVLWNVRAADAGSIVFSPSSLPPGTVGSGYSQGVLATDSDGAEDVNGPFDNDDVFTYTVTAGSLPPGLSLNFFNGTITGTPTTAGTYPFTVTATDLNNATGSQAYSVVIGGNILTVAPAALPSGTQGVSYNQTVTASGGTGPYTYSVSAGSLPAGLAINPSTGAITGIPTGSGASSFTIQANDTLGNFGTQAYTVNIGTNTLTINPASLPNATQGAAYSQTGSATGGTGPYTYSVTAGSLPAGLSLNSSSGAITGTPAASGPSSFTIQATDTNGNVGSRSYGINTGASSSLTVSPANLPNGSQGIVYSQTVTASGGSGPYTYSIISGSLPTGLTLSSGGVISGTPTGSGPSTFTIGATDSLGNAGNSPSYTLNIGTASLTVNPASLPAGTRSVAYSQTLTAAGGTGGPYTYSVLSGALPAGLTLTSGGLISGTPTVNGASAFRVRVLDSSGNSGMRDYTLSIGTASLTINPATLPAAMVGRRYSQTLAGSGGTGPYTYSISSGALPPGLSLNAATGVISGTPASMATVAFTIQVLDTVGDTGSRSYTMVNRPDPALDPEVQGLIASQVAAAQRFATAQVNNISHHLESLHDHFNPCSFNFGTMPPIDRGSPPAYAAPNQLYSPQDSYGAPMGLPPQNNPGPPPQMMRPDGSDCASSMAFWTSGSFQFGSMKPNGLTDSNKFITGGLTGGVDYRLSEQVIVGAAVGYGADRSDVGQNGSRSDSSSYSASVYASLRPFDPLFIDAEIGYGTLGYDNKRWVTGEGAIASGTRKGSYWFGGMVASWEMGRDGWKVAPYIGTDFMSATFDGYSETGSTASLLTYNQMKADAVSGTIGLRGSIDMPASFGTITPTARVEYRQTSQSAFDQAMFYSDLGAGTSSTFSQPNVSRGSVSGAVGLRARAAGGLAVELEYGLTSGSGALMAQTIRANLKMSF
jgi:uncharacterized protein YhjY with autotransporter beta-barrel domain